MTLTNSATGHPEILMRASSPVARRTVLMHRGHVVSGITIPDLPDALPVR